MALIHTGNNVFSKTFGLPSTRALRFQHCVPQDVKMLVCCVRHCIFWGSLCKAPLQPRKDSRYKCRWAHVDLPPAAKLFGTSVGLCEATSDSLSRCTTCWKRTLSSLRPSLIKRRFWMWKRLAQAGQFYRTFKRAQLKHTRMQAALG